MAKLYTDEMTKIISEAEESSRIDPGAPHFGQISEAFNLGITTMSRALTANLLRHDRNEKENMEREFLDCVNELCLKCGNYRDEHLGACDGCRWKEVKHGFR